MQHDGGGKPWLRVLARAPVLVTRPDFKGYTVTKTVEPVTQKVKGQWSMGDVARIKLRIIAAQDMGWVVVNDPVPAGAVLLGRGLLGLYGSTAYGPWVRVGQTSRAQCPLGTYPSWAGIGGLR